MQEFENYPELAEHIQRMASTGNTGNLREWSCFLEKLNAALLPSPVAGKEISEKTIDSILRDKHDELMLAKREFGKKGMTTGMPRTTDNIDGYIEGMREGLQLLLHPSGEQISEISDEEIDKKACEINFENYDHRYALNLMGQWYRSQLRLRPQEQVTEITDAELRTAAKQINNDHSYCPEESAYEGMKYLLSRLRNQPTKTE